MKHLLRSLPLVAFVAIAFSGCTESNTTQYQTRGRVVSLSPETNTVTILHEAIPDGGMDSHEMPFTVAEAEDLENLMVGDLVSFEYEVGADGSVVADDIEKLPADTQLTLNEPMPEPPVMPDTTMMMTDSTMVMEDTTTTL